MYQSQAHAHRGFPPIDRTSELAAELLDVVNASELQAFLGRLVAETAGRIGTRSSDELLGALQQIAERTVPTLTTALGSAPPASVAARRASRVFGVELEGVSAEDRDYEIARQFVRFARAAAAGSAAAPVGRAVAEAGREFAPGLLGSHPL